MKAMLKIAAAVFAVSSSIAFAASTAATAATTATTATTATSTAVSAKATASTATITAQDLVTKITHGELTIVKSFDVGHGLTGHVLKASAGAAQEMIAYTNKDNSMLFIGNLINANGNNLTGAFTNKYITSKKAVKAYSQIGSAHYVVDGKDSAPHKTYIFWDPNCSYCHLLYKEVEPLIAKGQLQVRWIPVAIRPESSGKTANILHASNADAVKMMAADEAKFNMSKEQGALKPLAKSNSASVKKAYTETKDNTNLFIANFLGTPVMLYKNLQGQPQVIPGFVQGAQLQTAVDSMSSKW